MRILNFIYRCSWVALLCGAAGRLFFWSEAPYLYVVSAIVLAVSQFFLRERGGDFVLRRLVVQQLLGALVLVVAGVLMFTHTRNEWMVAMFIGALLQLYTAYRIPQELEKQK